MVLEHQENCETKQARYVDHADFRLITDAHEVRQILDRLGVNHDPDSIVLEDTYGSILTNGEEYWGIHKSTPLVHSTAYRIR